MCISQNKMRIFWKSLNKISIRSGESKGFFGFIYQLIPSRFNWIFILCYSSIPSHPSKPPFSTTNSAVPSHLTLDELHLPPIVPKESPKSVGPQHLRHQDFVARNVGRPNSPVRWRQKHHHWIGEKQIPSLSSAGLGVGLLEELMVQTSGDHQLICRIYRWLALGFLKHQQLTPSRFASKIAWIVQASEHGGESTPQKKESSSNQQFFRGELLLLGCE